MHLLSALTEGSKCDMDVDNDDGTEGDAESGSESETGARRKVNPAQLLKIVSFLACRIFITHPAIEEGYDREHHLECVQSEVQHISGCDWNFPSFDAHAGPCHSRSPSCRYQHFSIQHITCYQIHVSGDS